MKNKNNSSYEWLNILVLGAIVFLVTAGILSLFRLDKQPIVPKNDLATLAPSTLPYPLPITGTEAMAQGYPPPYETATYEPTWTPEPTLPWVLIGTDEWGVPDTPMPTLGPPRIVTHEPGPFDIPIPLVPPAEDARGTLIYFVQSEDGRSVTAQGVELDGIAQVMSDNISISDPLKIPHGSILSSPDGSHVAIIDIGWGYAYILNTFTGKGFYLAEIFPADIFYNWHPNNTSVLFGNGGNLKIGDVETNYHITLISIFDAVGNIDEGVVSPDGQRYIYFYNKGVLDPGEVWLSSFDGKDAKNIYTGNAFYFSWSPNERYVAFYGIDGLMVFDQEKDEIYSVADYYRPACPYSHPLWSPDSQIIALTIDKGEGQSDCIGNIKDEYKSMDIILVDLITRRTFPLLSDGILGNIDPAWSPDGRYIAFVSNRSGAPEIWVAAVDGSDLHQITHAGGNVRFPFWRWP